MIKIKFVKTKEMHDGHFSREYLTENLVRDGLDYEKIQSNVSSELYQGSAGFVMYIDGQEIIGDEEFGFGYALYGVLMGLNNAVFDVLKDGKGKFDIYEFTSGKNYIHLERNGEKVNFTVDEKSPRFPIEGRSVELDQLVIEVINIVKEYRQIWEDVINKICPQKYEEILNSIFSMTTEGLRIVDGVNQIVKIDIKPEDIKKNGRICYSIWMPLDKAWEEYKQKKSK